MQNKLQIKFKSSGFTLVELLITVSIIAILTTIGAIAYASVNQGVRDTKRKSDLKFIQSALEQYYGDNFSYPLEQNGSSCADGVINSPIDDICALTKGGKIYISEIQRDPKASPYPQYLYKALPGSYCLYAAVESSSNVLNTTCTDQTGYNYEVSPP